MKKRILSIILTLCMLIGLMPMVTLMASAAGGTVYPYYVITKGVDDTETLAGNYHVYKKADSAGSFVPFTTSADTDTNTAYSTIAKAMTAITAEVSSGSATLQFGATGTDENATGTLEIANESIVLSTGTYNLKGSLKEIADTDGDTDDTLKLRGASIIIDGANLGNSGDDSVILQQYDPNTKILYGGSITMTGGAVINSGTGACIEYAGSGNITVSGGKIHSEANYAIENSYYSTGAVSVSGSEWNKDNDTGTLLESGGTAVGSSSALNSASANTTVTVTGGTLKSVTATVMCSSPLDIVGGSIEATTGPAMLLSGSTCHVSGGTITSANTAVPTADALLKGNFPGTVLVTDINNNNAKLYISGGTISNTKSGSPAIYNFSFKDYDSTNFTLTSDLYLSGTPYISGSADIWTNRGIHAKDGTTPYTGNALKVEYGGTITSGTTAMVSDVTSGTNDGLFSITNTGYTLSLSSSDLIMKAGVAASTWADDGKNAVDGTDYTISGNTYTIKTERGLAWVAYQVDYTADGKLITESGKTAKNSFEGKTIVLDAASGAFDMAKYDWLPIGNSFSPFKAVALYGKGDQTIKNLIIESDGTGFYIGFIGICLPNETPTAIHNLVFSNAQITENVPSTNTTETATGILAGMLVNANVSDVRVISSGISFTNASTQDSNVGGLIGRINLGSVERIFVSGTPITVNNKSYVKVGGIIGRLSSASLGTAYCDADIHVNKSDSAVGYVGGLAGESYGDIINSHVSGSVDTQGCGFAGGISGFTVSGIYNCYSTAAVSGGKNAYVGGVTGYNYAPETVQNCYSTGTLAAGKDQSGGLVGRGQGSIAYSYWLDTTCPNTIAGSKDYGSNNSAETIEELRKTDGVMKLLNDNIGKLGTKYPWSQWIIKSGVNNGMPMLAQCTLSYNGNGSTVGTAPSPEAVSFGETVTAAASGSLTKTGYHLTGWNTKADGKGTTYASGAALTVLSDMTLYAIWAVDSTSGGGGYDTHSRTITVTETKSDLFTGSKGQIKAEANMTNAFSDSVEVKVTDTKEKASNFGLGAGNEVFPFDISLYIKGTNTKTEPKDGYAVTISLPVPDNLLNEKEQLSILHKSDNGTVTTLKSQLKQVNGVWYLVFDATEFSPYALVLRSIGTYDESAGLPYYVSDGSNVFIGFAANGKYIAPAGVTVLFKKNAKSFTDTESHWAKDYIGFVAERELFGGTGNNKFEPETGMTRAMLATVIGRLYERSYGEIKAQSTHSFSDCDYSAYYGKYVDWAAKEGIITGYGNSQFGPSDQITREQMAAMLYRFADYLSILPSNMNTSLTYTDAGTISSWARSAALYCQSTGVITGRDGGSFAPNKTATRAEVAAIIKRFIKAAMN